MIAFFKSDIPLWFVVLAIGCMAMLHSMAETAHRKMTFEQACFSFCWTLDPKFKHHIDFNPGIEADGNIACVCK